MINEGLELVGKFGCVPEGGHFHLQRELDHHAASVVIGVFIGINLRLEFFFKQYKVICCVITKRIIQKSDDGSFCLCTFGTRFFWAWSGWVGGFSSDSSGFVRKIDAGARGRIGA